MITQETDSSAEESDVDVTQSLFNIRKKIPSHSIGDSPRVHDSRSQATSLTREPTISIEEPVGGGASHFLSHHMGKSLDEEFVGSQGRRGSWQGSQQGSRQVSPVPSDLGDFVIVSMNGARRASDALNDWTMIEQGLLSKEEESIDLDEGDVESLEMKKLYLLVARCIAYPFNATFQIESTPPRPKLNANRFGQICRTIRLTLENFDNVEQDCDNRMNPQEQEVARGGEKFRYCLKWMLDTVFSREEVQEKCSNGGWSAKELDTIFSIKASTVMSEEEENMRESEIAEEVTLWSNTFRKLIEHCSLAFLGQGTYVSSQQRKLPSSSTTAAPKQDKLYKIFQQILNIKSLEHQVLYRECQLGSPEEQEAVVRRELQTRKKSLLRSNSLVEGKLGSHKLEHFYREEQLKMVKHLSTNLDTISLQGSSVSTLEKKKKKGSCVSESGNMPLTKQDLLFNLKVKVVVHDIYDLQPPYEGKNIFCVFGMVDNGRDPLQTRPVEPEYGSASFSEEGEFWVCSPIPQVKLELRSVSKGLFSDSKLIAKYTHTALPSSSDSYSTLSLYHNDKDIKEGVTPIGKLKISTVVERPSSIKKSGYLFAVGRSMFKSVKKRFFALIQLSQYKFLLCSYQPSGTQPRETLLMDQGLSVEYASDSDPLSSEPEAKYMFDLVFENSESGRIQFGCRDDADRQSWIEWMVRGTGQSYQPQQLGAEEVARTGSTDLERHGLQKAVDSASNVHSLDPHKLFSKLFQATLEFRFSEDLFSRGLFSPDQMYVLDEFCARYGVRDPFHHLTCLQYWLDYLEEGMSIWPVMIQSSFRFCQMHVGGMNPPEKSVIVTTEEREVFGKVCHRIEDVVLYQLQHFRTQFPFCSPKNDLRTTLKLFDLVATINHSSLPSSDVPSQQILTHTMEKAALTNYKQVYAMLKLSPSEEDLPLPMSGIFQLTQLSIEFMYELHDFFWEEFNQSSVFAAHVNAFWAFFLVDMKRALRGGGEKDTVRKLQLFHLINRYFCSQPTFNLGEFHVDFLNEFTPVVVDYIDTLEKSLQQELATSLPYETWLPVTDKSCASVEGVMKSLLSFKRFLAELSWPAESFSAFLEQKVAAICADRFQEAADVIQVEIGALMLSSKGSPLTYSIPHQFFTMINTVVYLSSQAVQLCSSQIIQTRDVTNDEESSLEHDGSLNIEDYLADILNTIVTMAISKLCNPLKDILLRFTRLDPSEGFLASLKKIIPVTIPIDAYEKFLATNLDSISKHLAKSFSSNFIVNWYECQMQLLNQWLESRPEFSLTSTQLASTADIFKTLYTSFVKCDVRVPLLRSQSHDTVEERIRVESSHSDLLSIGKS